MKEREHSLIIRYLDSSIHVKNVRAAIILGWGGEPRQDYYCFIADCKTREGHIDSLLPTIQLLGRIHTTPSYLNKYDKNNVIHESFVGRVTSYERLVISSDMGLPYPPISYWGLQNYPVCKYVSHPVTFHTHESFIECETVMSGSCECKIYKHPHRQTYVGIGADWVRGSYFIRSSTKLNSLKNLAQGWCDQTNGEGFDIRYRDFGIDLDVLPENQDPDLISLIKKGKQLQGLLPYFGEEFFLLGKDSGLNAALSNAAGTADGFHFSRLATEIALDGLVIKTISDLASKSVRSIAKAGPLAEKLKLCFKLLPSVYLGYQYGISAPIREYCSLPGALDSQFSDEPIGSLVGSASSSYRGFQTQTRVSLNIGALTSRRQIANLTYLTKGGLSLDDLWEVVPLSFVIDWFLNISGFLEAGRRSQIYSELPIESLTHSTVFEQPVELPFRVFGPVTHRCYLREYLQGSSLPKNIFGFQIKDIKGTLSLRNVDEGLALFLSYLI